MAIRTAADLREAARRAGSHFFSRDTMRFWASRLHSVYEVPDGAVFVTSEKSSFDDPTREFRVRIWNESEGSSKTLVDSIKTLSRAQSIARSEAAKRRS